MAAKAVTTRPKKDCATRAAAFTGCSNGAVGLGVAPVAVAKVDPTPGLSGMAPEGDGAGLPGAGLPGAGACPGAWPGLRFSVATFASSLKASIVLSPVVALEGLKLDT